jgi:hypothetical protein
MTQSERTAWKGCGMATRKEVAEYLEANGWNLSHSMTADPCVSPHWEKFIHPWDVPLLPDRIRAQDPIIVVKLEHFFDAEVEDWLRYLASSARHPSGCRESEHYAYPTAIAPIIERFGNPAPSDTINQPQETP